MIGTSQKSCARSFRKRNTHAVLTPAAMKAIPNVGLRPIFCDRKPKPNMPKNAPTLIMIEVMPPMMASSPRTSRSEEHTSELQSPCNLVCRLLLEKKKKHRKQNGSDYTGYLSQ